MQEIYKKKSSWVIILLVGLMVAFVLASNSVLADSAVQPGSQVSSATQEDGFTEVAGAGQSVTSTRNKNDSSLIYAGLFGLATILILGLTSHARSKRNLAIIEDA